MSVKRVLLIAYVFPPFGSVGSSVRVVKFVKYLPLSGWKPTVLTITDDPRYELLERSSSFLQGEIPPSTEIVRTRTWQPRLRVARTNTEGARPIKSWVRRVLRRTKVAALHFVRDHLLITDEYLVWCPFAATAGYRLNKKMPFDVIFATIPPYSVALSAWVLKVLARKPLVLDVRDDWVDGRGRYFRKGPHLRRLERWLESRVVHAASRVVAVTEASQSAFRQRYPHLDPAKFVLIPNGCDLADYDSPAPPAPVKTERFTLLHSGVLPRDRNPEPLFRALRDWLSAENETHDQVRLTLIGNLLPEHAAAIEAFGLQDVVEVRPYLPASEYRSALRSADVLLAINYERAPTLIPGKLYEYWVAGRPILLLADEGAATELVLKYNLGFVAPPGDAGRIQQMLGRLYQLYRHQDLPGPDPSPLAGFDRKHLTEQLAQVMQELVS